MTPVALHATLTDLMVQHAKAPLGVLAGVDHPEPPTRLILNAADEASGRLQAEGVGQVLLLPPSPLSAAKRAMLEDVLLDLDQPYRLMLLIWREPMDPGLAQAVAERLQAGVAAMVLFAGPASALPPALARLVPHWYTLD